VGSDYIRRDGVHEIVRRTHLRTLLRHRILYLAAL
jgi:hypothetical protein